MARKVTKEEIAEGVFIDGGQLERMSDDIVDRYNELQLNDLQKKYQTTQVIYTDGTQVETGKVFVYQQHINGTQTATVPHYPLAGGSDLIKNEFRTKGYWDNIGSPNMTDSATPSHLIFQHSIGFNKSVVLTNWALHIQCGDAYYTFDPETGGSPLITGGVRAIITGKNFFDQRERAFDTVVMNRDIDFNREAFYSTGATDTDATTVGGTRFPTPPVAPQGAFVEHHLNIPVPEQGQLFFSLIVPVNRTGAPWNVEINPTWKVTGIVSYLEEIE